VTVESTYGGLQPVERSSPQPTRVGDVGRNREGRRRDVLIVAGHDPDRLLPPSASQEAEPPWVFRVSNIKRYASSGVGLLTVGLEQVTSE
jgi:hypothetical protein